MRDLPEPITDNELGVSVERFDADVGPRQRLSARQRGFTLIELMVTVVVISVLALIALPSYQQFVRQARRVEAQAELINLQRAFEKYRVNNPSYDGCVAAGACSIPTSDYYTYSVSDASETGYSLSAEAKGAQAADSDCSPLKLNQNSVKGPSGCWKD